MRALADAGERRRMHFMSGLPQNRREPRPYPAAAPGAVDQEERQDCFCALSTPERSTSSSLTAALRRASISAFRRGVSLLASSKASASLKLNAASALGSGFFCSVPASVPYTRAESAM